tara:strand:- start:3853 stop:4083 length:231 start_codon:yes stop_codon:yes gene_type:complete
MADNVTTSSNEIVIELMSGTADYQETRTTARTVGELKRELGLTGTIAVNRVIATDETPLEEGSKVVFRGSNMKGGC